MATINLGRVKPVFRGAYNASTSYVIDDIVTYQDETYIAITATTGNLPTVTSNWTKLAAKGTDVGTTLTTQGDILYRDASGLARLGAGTSGQFLKTQGTGANPLWADAGGGLQSIQSFTSSGSYTWTKPTGINKVKVIVTGAGGGGSNTSNGTSSGGGAGGTAIKVVDVSSLSTVSVTVGAGGAGSASTYGATGGTSSFGSHCSATGGTGGSEGTNPPGGHNYSGGEGGVGSSGDINITGGSTFRLGGLNAQSIGGNSFWGGGGRGSNGGDNINGSNGGGGGCAYSGSDGTGTGGNGVVYVEEYK